MFTVLILLLTLFASTSLVVAQGAACSSTSQCGSTSPCCSEFGFCGDGIYCLGGCNPLSSSSPSACQPQPVCQSGTLTFADTSRILINGADYDGNATKYDWIVDKGNITVSNGELAMILTETNGGTRLSSTRYLHYGTVSAKLKTGRWAGVVVAFITMSSIKDEIDWEFPGASTTQGQTNYFWQGVITNPTHGATAQGISDTYSNYHEYAIDWKPDTLSFLIDGNNVRTIKASDAQSGGVSQYPNTPSRIQLSIWPAGINSSAQGTVDWAGGMINWDDPDYKAAGQFAAYISSVDIQCGDPSAPSSNTTSYVYGSNSSTSTPQISFSGASTSLKNSSSLSNSNKKFTSSLAFKIAFIVGAVVLLLVAALIVRACMKKMGSKKVAKPAGLGGLGFGGKQQAYQPLQNPLASASVESHGMQQQYGGRRY